MSFLALFLPFYGPAPRIQVAVVDTGINFVGELEGYACPEGHFDATGTGLEDRHGHGTNLVAKNIVKGISPRDICLINLKWYDIYSVNDPLMSVAIQSVPEGTSFINISGGGEVHYAVEALSLLDYVESGVTVVAAAGNGGRSLDKNCNFYPACYFIHKNMHPVGATNPRSNKGKRLHIEEANSTSEAAAIHTNRLIKQRLGIR